jgi:hypothetical protein
MTTWAKADETASVAIAAVSSRENKEGFIAGTRQVAGTRQQKKRRLFLNAPRL